VAPGGGARRRAAPRGRACGRATARRAASRRAVRSRGSPASAFLSRQAAASGAPQLTCSGAGDAAAARRLRPLPHLLRRPQVRCARAAPLAARLSAMHLFADCARSLAPQKRSCRATRWLACAPRRSSSRVRFPRGQRRASRRLSLRRRRRTRGPSSPALRRRRCAPSRRMRCSRWPRPRRPAATSRPASCCSPKRCSALLPTRCFSGTLIRACSFRFLRPRS